MEAFEGSKKKDKALKKMFIAVLVAFFLKA
jgi:hypothetical protein